MKRIIVIVSLLIALTTVGTLGFHFITGTDWLDSIYQTIITLTTVGSREPVDLDDSGKIFIVTYLVLGLGIFTYSAFQLGQWIVSAQLRSLFVRRRMEKSIQKLQNHYIVCGLGRMGRTICEYLAKRRKPFVVIENDEDRLKEVCERFDWLYIQGDATDDAVLVEAGINQAQSLASVVSSDGDNVYVVLSARLLADNLQIIVRASDEKAAQKMERAGANRVISPFSTGAVKMARFMISPNIEDFLEIADEHGNELELTEFVITESNPYIGKELQQTDMRSKGVMVIGIRRSDGERLMPPSGSARIRLGDSLFTFGTKDAIGSVVEETGDGVDTD